jgi:hypothetical protein
MRFSVVVVALALGLACVGTGSAARSIQHFFFAPGNTTSCQMDASVPKIGTAAYCQTYPHVESVTLNAAGNLTICHGVKCIGNPPDQVPTLVYGSWLDAGPFRCTSTPAGVKCVVRRTGRGFLISPTSIKRV